MSRRLATSLLGGAGLALLLLGTPPGLAEDASPPPSQTTGRAGEQASQRPPTNRRDDATGEKRHGLPADVGSKHTLELPGRTLAFQATVGSIRLSDEKGEPEADVVFTAYRLDGADPKTRPVTFFFNGGPGSASAWLQLGCAGPWRIGMSGDALSPSASPDLVPNLETWLDFTDLVFIDPPGTGWSRLSRPDDEKLQKRLWSVAGDARAVATVIRRWLERSNRLLSPKFVVGESYGGIRGPKVVRDLETREGVGVRGLILVSPVLDFGGFGGRGVSRFVANLPTMAAVARAARGPVERADLAEVERWAATDFLLDLVRGEADVAATRRIVDHVADLTGIDRATVDRLAGRLDPIEFRRALGRDAGRVAGRYDASVSAPDPYPDSSFFRFDDPSSEPLIAPITSAVVDLTTRRLGWRPDGSYRLLNGDVSRRWDWGRGLRPPDSIDEIRQLLANDPALKLIVAHGLFDLAAPYFGSKILLDQLPPSLAAPGRLEFVVYPGGHMFYARDAARRALRARAEALIKP